MNHHPSNPSQHAFPHPAPTASPKMLRLTITCFTSMLLAINGFAAEPAAHSIEGRVVESGGKGIEGVMVSAIDDDHRKWTSVFTQKDGSFSIVGLRNVRHSVRTRLLGLADQWMSDVAVDADAMVIAMRSAEGEELEIQRPANSAFSMLAFDDPRDKLNFKMMCAYCHQIGTVGFSHARRARRLGNHASTHGRIRRPVPTHSRNDHWSTDGDLQGQRC